MARLPSNFDQLLGKITIRRGYLPVQDYTGKELTKLALFSWDVVPPCNGELCPANHLCDYTKDLGKCLVTSTYLRAAAQTIFQNFSEILDEPTLYRIGIHLMPAYRTLCRLKIEELGVTKVISISSQGKPTANPIYREIRETIKLVEFLWEKLGLSKYQVLPPGANLEPQMSPIPSKPATDGMSYYDRLEKGLVKTKSQLRDEEEDQESEPDRSAPKPKLVLRSKR